MFPLNVLIITPDFKSKNSFEIPDFSLYGSPRNSFNKARLQFAARFSFAMLTVTANLVLVLVIVFC